MESKNIYFLGMNPKGHDYIRYGEEYNSIEDGVKKDSRELKDSGLFFEPIMILDRSLDDLFLSLTRITFRISIFHFSGHGLRSGKYIFLSNKENEETEICHPERIVDYLRLSQKQTLDCVILNACYSLNKAEYFFELTDRIIAVDNAIPIDTSIEFVKHFYNSLAGDKSVDNDAIDLAFNKAKDIITNINKNESGHYLKLLKKEEWFPTIEVTEEAAKKALHRINYKKEEEEFEIGLATKRAFFCLIKGKNSHGQKWLYNKLLEKREYLPNQRPPFPFGTSRIRTYDEFKKYLRRKLDLESVSEENIINGLVQVLRTRSCVIIIHEPSESELQKELESFLENFWGPLCNKLNKGSSNLYQYLVVFLVEYRKDESELSKLIDLIPENDLVKLPCIEKFNETTFKLWRTRCKVGGINWVPQKYGSYVDKRIFDLLHKNSCEGIPEGDPSEDSLAIPELFFDHIFDELNFDWNDWCKY